MRLLIVTGLAVLGILGLATLSYFAQGGDAESGAFSYKRDELREVAADESALSQPIATSRRLARATDRIPVVFYRPDYSIYAPGEVSQDLVEDLSNQLIEWGASVAGAAANGVLYLSAVSKLGLDGKRFYSDGVAYYIRVRPTHVPDDVAVEVFSEETIYLLPRGGGGDGFGQVRIQRPNDNVFLLGGAIWGGSIVFQCEARNWPIAMPKSACGVERAPNWISVDGEAWVEIEHDGGSDLKVEPAGSGVIAVQIVGEVSIAGLSLRLIDGAGRCVVERPKLERLDQRTATTRLGPLVPGVYTIQVISDAVRVGALVERRMTVDASSTVACPINLPAPDRQKIRAILHFVSKDGARPSLPADVSVICQPVDARALLNGASSATLVQESHVSAAEFGGMPSLMAVVPEGLPKGVYAVKVNGLEVAAFELETASENVFHFELPVLSTVEVQVLVDGTPSPCDLKFGHVQTDGGILNVDWKARPGATGVYTLEAPCGWLVLVGSVSGMGQNVTAFDVSSTVESHTWAFNRTKEIVLRFESDEVALTIDCNSIIPLGDARRRCTIPVIHGIRYLEVDSGSGRCSGIAVTLDADAKHFEFLLPPRALFKDDRTAEESAFRFSVAIGGVSELVIDLTDGSRTVLSSFR